MRPLYGVVRLLEVSAARRVLIYYGNGNSIRASRVVRLMGSVRYLDCLLWEVLLYMYVIPIVM